MRTMTKRSEADARPVPLARSAPAPPSARRWREKAFRGGALSPNQRKGMTQKRSELPWTKREIIDAVISKYEPPDVKDLQRMPFLVLLRAFTVLGLGRPDGRAATYVEHALCQR